MDEYNYKIGRTLFSFDPRVHTIESLELVEDINTGDIISIHMDVGSIKPWEIENHTGTKMMHPGDTLRFSWDSRELDLEE